MSADTTNACTECGGNGTREKPWQITCPQRHSKPFRDYVEIFREPAENWRIALYRVGSTTVILRASDTADRTYARLSEPVDVEFPARSLNIEEELAAIEARETAERQAYEQRMEGLRTERDALLARRAP